MEKNEFHAFVCSPISENEMLNTKCTYKSGIIQNLMEKNKFHEFVSPPISEYEMRNTKCILVDENSLFLLYIALNFH